MTPERLAELKKELMYARIAATPEDEEDVAALGECLDEIVYLNNKSDILEKALKPMLDGLEDGASVEALPVSIWHIQLKEAFAKLETRK
jgi:hypothetical protein